MSHISSVFAVLNCEWYDLQYLPVTFLKFPLKVGMFKIHPKVPECMSDTAKGFIMNCFTPNPDDRATAEQLLMNTFLRSSPRKKVKALQEPETYDCVTAGGVTHQIRLCYTTLPCIPTKTCCYSTCAHLNRSLAVFCSWLSSQLLRTYLQLGRGHRLVLGFNQPFQFTGPQAQTHVDSQS